MRPTSLGTNLAPKVAGAARPQFPPLAPRQEIPPACLLCTSTWDGVSFLPADQAGRDEHVCSVRSLPRARSVQIDCDCS